MIGIIDYGAGNLRSVKKAFDFINVPSCIVNSGKDFLGIDKLVLPGVGAFKAAVYGLRQEGLFERTITWIQSGKPFLGICLGLQLLFETSEEASGVRGMALFKGTARRFRKGKVPQIGWNQVLSLGNHCPEGSDNGTWYYFLHGYYIDRCEPGIVAGTTEYGITYPSIIASGNVTAVQFHPEKSGKAGIVLLKKWAAECFQ